MRQHLLVILIIAGAFLGALCGWIWGPAMEAVAFLGTFFLNALRMIVVPIVIFSMIVGVASLGDVRRIGRVGAKTVAYYFATTAIAVLIGLVLVNLLQPGVGVESAGRLLSARPGVETRLVDLFLSLVHPNIFAAMAETKILPLIVVSLLFGGALTTMGDRGRVLLRLCGTLSDAVIKIVHLVLWFAPVGVFALVASKLGATGGGAAFLGELARVGKYSLTVLIGLAIQACVVLPLLLFLFTRRSPLRYAWGMIEALVTAFSTASSSATLPVTLEAVKERNGVSEGAADFVLPIGATINMDGTALYEAVAAMFIAQLYGIEMGFAQQAIIFVTATLASIGAAGIPQAGLVTMIIVLEAVGLPVEGIGVLLAVDWFLDRCRTTVNVWGDSIGAAVIGQSGELRGR